MSAHTNNLLIGIPIALRVVNAKNFTRGPFHLGPASFPIAVTSVCWILFISIAFILPTANPINAQTLNYSIVAVGIVITYSVGFWLISARKWFTGPIKQIAGACPCQRGRSLFDVASFPVESTGVDVMNPVEEKSEKGFERVQTVDGSM